MPIRPIVPGALALLLCLGLSSGPVVAQENTQAPAQDTMKEAEVESSEILCSDCHEQGATFATNPHARGKVVETRIPNAVCESCHGSGTEHIDGGGDTTKIVHPKGRTGAETCLKCHDKNTDQDSRHGGMHANSETVNCLTCHSVHSSDPMAKFMLAKKQLALCSSCHQTQAASFRNNPYAHRLGRGGMECSSCHNPHGRAGKESLKRTKAGEMPCLSCHAEKRGPFVFPHPGAEIGECMVCHQPHGSSNGKQRIRNNAYQVCLECHSPITGDTIASQPPSFHNLSLARYKNCTTCHVAVHGSNRSPNLLK